MIYLDTSVVVAYYLPEPLSAHAQQVYESHENPAVSELVELEVFAALSLRLRIGDLSREDVEQVAGLFLGHLEGDYYTRLQMRSEHYRLARDFIARFDLPLKGPDALHLAVSSTERLKLVTADQQLARNAQALGAEVELIRP